MSRSRSRSRSRNRSRSRTRSRSRSRDRYRNRNRGGRDRDRDRDRDRRGKDRDRKDRRDRDNSPRRRRNSSRSQSPSNRHYDHKSRNHDYNRRQNNESNRVLKPGEPNNYIILQGLHANVSDQSVHATLDALQASYENIKVIRDKQTGLARGFAFVKFISIEHARQFIDTYFPYIDVEGTKVKIDYSTSTSHEDEDWNCSQCGFLNFKRRDQCYKCGVPKNASATQFAASLPLPGEINDGEKDIGETPINILLLRYLDPISTEDTIYNTMCMLSPVKEVRLVKDRLSKVSWGFAFVEYYDLDAANAAYYYIYQNGYQIDNRPISVSYAHINSFIPVYVQNEWSTVSYTDDKGNVKFMKYWDEQAYVSIYPPPEHVPLPNTAESYANRLAVTTEETNTTNTLNENDKPDNSVTILHKTNPKPETKISTKSNKFEIKIDLKKSAASAKPKEDMNDLLNAFYSDIKEDMKDTPSDHKKNIFSVEPTITSNPLDSMEKEKKKFVSINEKKMKNQIQKWEEKRNEANNTSNNTEKEPVAIPTVEEINRKFINYQSNACLLCLRGFSSAESLTKHQNISKLHKGNIEEYIRKFKEEHNIPSNEYRNRAEERRELYGQNSKPTNIGLKMLQNMGWKDGEGLGKDNSNSITEPIEPQNYSNGVGLGLK